MKLQEIGIFISEMPQLPVFKTLWVLGAAVFLVMAGWGISVWNRHDKCVDQMLGDPSFESWTIEQKAARFDECMD